MKTKPVATKSFILKFRIFIFLGLATFLFITQPALAEEALSDDWEFSVSVYGWGTSIEGETAEGGDIDITFKDILENLNFAYMGSVGVNKGKWGFVTDVIYLNVEDGSNHSLNRKLTLSNVEL